MRQPATAHWPVRPPPWDGTALTPRRGAPAPVTPLHNDTDDEAEEEDEDQVASLFGSGGASSTRAPPAPRRADLWEDSDEDEVCPMDVRRMASSSILAAARRRRRRARRVGGPSLVGLVVGAP